MKQVAGKMRLDLAQYRELAAFAQFSSDLDAKTKAQLDKGARVSEILKQGWDEPLQVAEQVMLIWLVTEGYAGMVELGNMGEWKNIVLNTLRSDMGSSLMRDIQKEAKLTDPILKEMKKLAETIELETEHLSNSKEE